MTEKHIYNFSGRGPENRAYIKLWLWLFHDGLFARVRPSAWRIYCRLLYSADSHTRECTISQGDLSKDCGIRRQGIPELIRELQGHRLLATQQQISRAGQLPNVYYIAKPPAPVEDITDEITYAGHIVADREVDITISSQKKTAAHVRLSRELFDSGFFVDLSRNHTAWKVYCSLLFRADFEDGFAFPQIGTIETDCNISRATIIKNIKYLENCGLIAIKKRQTAKGNIANSYYVWPLSENTYGTEFKKRTPGSLKSGHLKVQLTDTSKFKKQTPQGVRNLNCNLNNQNINTTCERAGDISENNIENLLTDFYSVNSKRLGVNPGQGVKWLTKRVGEYGLDLVKYVVTCAENKDLYAISRLDSCIESLAWVKQRRTRQKSQMVTENRLGQDELETEASITNRIAAKRELIADYQAQLKNGGPMSRIFQSSVNRLERELAELEQQGG